MESKSFDDVGIGTEDTPYNLNLMIGIKMQTRRFLLKYFKSWIRKKKIWILINGCETSQLDLYFTHGI